MDLNINEEFGQLNEANIFSKIMIGLGALISAAFLKTMKTAIKSKNTAMIKTFMNSILVQAEEGTKNKKYPDGFNKIIQIATTEVITDFEKYSNVYDGILDDIKNNDNKPLPSNFNTLTNMIDTFNKKYHKNLEANLNAIINEYDKQIRSSIDALNKDKKQNFNNAIKGDKLTALWDSYKIKLEDIKDKKIEEFQESPEYKKLHDLIMGPIDDLKIKIETEKRNIIFNSKNSNKKSQFQIKSITVNINEEENPKDIYKFSLLANSELAPNIPITKVTNYEAFYFSTNEENYYNELNNKIKNIKESAVPEIKTLFKNISENIKSSNTSNKIGNLFIYADNNQIKEREFKGKFEFNIEFNIKELGNNIPFLVYNTYKAASQKDKDSLYGGEVVTQVYNLFVLVVNNNFYYVGGDLSTIENIKVI